jgi:hypothetical protein
MEAIVPVEGMVFPIFKRGKCRIMQENASKIEG